ncbi:MAG: leucine-rich repeat protein [Ruminococcus sp.]|nr:leucine-rich repeat protein [Ruminococcus sp.]
MISAHAEIGYDVFSYYIEPSGEITITDCDKNATSVEIPEQIDGKVVRYIGGEAFDGCDILTSISMPDTITDIYDSRQLGHNAFRCKNLKSIRLSESLKTIKNISCKQQYIHRSCYSLL